MKVYRYMSNREFELFTAGCEIDGKPYFNARTNSEGICFLPESIEFEDADGETHVYDAIAAYAFLRGIVSSDVLVEFETETELTESCGYYADPYGGWYDGITVRELCTPSYSRENMVALRYHIPGDGRTWYGAN